MHKQITKTYTENKLESTHLGWDQLNFGKKFDLVALLEYIGSQMIAKYLKV